MSLPKDNMKIILFSSNIDIINEWKQRHNIKNSTICYDISSLNNELKDDKNSIVIADYDTVASGINTLISSATIPENLIILEKAPAITTGKTLIFRGIKAYGNSRMLTHHYNQMINTVLDSNIWTYPELTAEISRTNTSLNDNSIELIENRLSSKELDVVYLILNGLTNDAIAKNLDITTRTVKAHISSIFSKLHVNDRVSLVLLLK